jgi:hypothetical protein
MDVIQVVNRANQRGGRMLSVIDLIERETLPLRLAAELLRRVRAGFGFLVGASPGGAGKTAVMGALLTMLPSDSTVHLTSGSGWRDARPGEYVVAYEISPASYEAYIWDRDLRDMCALAGRGCRLVSNLHADTLDEARDQVVGQNGVFPEQFQSFETFIPIQTGSGTASVLRGGMRRRIDHCYVAEEGSWTKIDANCGPPPRGIGAFLERCLADGTRRIEEVRARWLASGGSA